MKILQRFIHPLNVLFSLNVHIKTTFAYIFLEKGHKFMVEKKWHINQRGKILVCEAEVETNCKFQKNGHYSHLDYQCMKLWATKHKKDHTKAETLLEFYQANPLRDAWEMPKLNDPFKLPSVTLSPGVKAVSKVIYPVLNNFYELGKTLSGTKLKNYTSGDHNDTGLEKTIVNCIEATADYLKIPKLDYKISQEYFRPTLGDGDLDEMRMDQHVFYRGKLTGLIENRAWIDKPFYQLKRNVIQTFESLPHTSRFMTPETKFAFISLNMDIQNRLITTQDKVYTPQHELVHIVLSKGSRSQNKGNYFLNGLNPNAVDNLSYFLLGLFK